MPETQTLCGFGPAAAVFGAVLLVGGAAGAQSGTNLAPHFGFEEPRIVVVDQGAGPAIVADFDGDGLQDFATVNNRKSRIEIYTQRTTPRTEEELERSYRVNEIRPNPWYDRTDISVAHRVSALRAHDVDGDGRLDIVYAGQPDEIVVLRQKSRLTFEVHTKRRIRGMAMGQNGLEIADVMGDENPELLLLASGKIEVYALTSDGPVGEPLRLGTGGDIVAFFIEDYNGDGKQDILAAIPEDAAPLRLWLQGQSGARLGSGKEGVLGPEVRFEMPAIREAEPIRFADRSAASIAVIERATRRIVVYDVMTEAIESVPVRGVERDALAEVYAFAGSAKDRGVAVGDIDGDGLPDILVTDGAANSVLLYRQRPGLGITESQSFSAFKAPKTLALGQWDSDSQLEVFILSEEDKSVGVAQYNAETGRIGFPQPVSLATAGASPVAMQYVRVGGEPALAIVVQRRRDHTLEIHRPGDAEVVAIELTGVNRPPQSMMAGDFDHDGRTDLILFTPHEPMVMVRNIDGSADEAVVLTDEKMPQFGLVQAAGPENTARLDLDGDGYDELLIAEKNFVRACSFDGEKGWRVVDQITMPDASSELTGLTTLELGGRATIVAADRTNKRLVLMARAEDGAWQAVDRLRMSGFTIGSVWGGAFSGDGQPNILCTSGDSFAIIRFAGERIVLEEVAAYRSDEENRLEHEIEAGDVNGDGFVDMIVLDAREQMCQIFTFSESRRLHLATEFKVFESRLFGSGDTRQFEPSNAFVADLTGNGHADLMLQVHDRFIIYPQMVEKRAGE